MTQIDPTRLDLFTQESLASLEQTQMKQNLPLVLVSTAGRLNSGSLLYHEPSFRRWYGDHAQKDPISREPIDSFDYYAIFPGDQNCLHWIGEKPLEKKKTKGPTLTEWVTFAAERDAVALAYVACQVASGPLVGLFREGCAAKLLQASEQVSRETKTPMLDILIDVLDYAAPRPSLGIISAALRLILGRPGWIGEPAQRGHNMGKFYEMLACIILRGTTRQAEVLTQRLGLTAAELSQPMHDVDTVQSVWPEGRIAPTPLMFAAANARTEMVQWLQRKQVDFSVRDATGRDAMAWYHASDRHDDLCVAYLRRWCPDPRAQLDNRAAGGGRRRPGWQVRGPEGTPLYDVSGHMTRIDPSRLDLFTRESLASLKHTQMRQNLPLVLTSTESSLNSNSLLYHEPSFRRWYRDYAPEDPISRVPIDSFNYYAIFPGDPNCLHWIGEKPLNQKNIKGDTLTESVTFAANRDPVALAYVACQVLAGLFIGIPREGCAEKLLQGSEQVSREKKTPLLDILTDVVDRASERPSLEVISAALQLLPGRPGWSGEPAQRLHNMKKYLEILACIILSGTPQQAKTLTQRLLLTAEELSQPMHALDLVWVAWPEGEIAPTPLMFAALNGKSEMVRWLQRKQVDFSVRDATGRDAMDWYQGSDLHDDDCVAYLRRWCLTPRA